MVKLVVGFPEALRDKAEAAARDRGLTLDEFVRQCVISTVENARLSDPLFADTEAYTVEAPADLAENHDAYLYGSDQ